MSITKYSTSLNPLQITAAYIPSNPFLQYLQLPSVRMSPPEMQLQDPEAEVKICALTPCQRTQ